MTEGAKLPLVVVFHDGTDHWLADGFHRFFANKKTGAVTMAADVRLGTLADARLHAYGANKGHGLRPTNADKTKAVRGMLADHAVERQPDRRARRRAPFERRRLPSFTCGFRK